MSINSKLLHLFYSILIFFFLCFKVIFLKNIFYFLRHSKQNEYFSTFFFSIFHDFGFIFSFIFSFICFLWFQKCVVVQNKKLINNFVCQKHWKRNSHPLKFNWLEFKSVYQSIDELFQLTYSKVVPNKISCHTKIIINLLQ